MKADTAEGMKIRRTQVASLGEKTFKVCQNDLCSPKSGVDTIISGYYPLQNLEGLIASNLD